jgi:hypothetical protein
MSSSKVSLLWAICGAVDLALPYLRWLLCAASISLLFIPRQMSDTVAEWACYAWAVVFLIDKGIDRLVHWNRPSTIPDRILGKD